MHNVRTIANSTIIENIFQKNIKACDAIVLTYSLEVDIILHILSVIAVNMLSELEFWAHCINSSFRNQGIQFDSSMYPGTHNWASDDCNFSSHDIRDCNNSVHRLKKKGIRIINPARIKNVAIMYVINIPNPLFFVILCQKIIHHSSANEIMKAAITI